MKVIEEGFDMNKAKGGLLGKGIYFADSAAKSDAYTAGGYRRGSFGSATGDRQILQCQVVLGRTEVRKSFRSASKFGAARTALSNDIQDGYDR